MIAFNNEPNETTWQANFVAMMPEIEQKLGLAWHRQFPPSLQLLTEVQRRMKTMSTHDILRWPLAPQIWIPASPGVPINMNCTLCDHPAPSNIEATIDEGWIPSYFSGQQQMPGPVCPECCKKHLRIGKDGDWETVAAPADSHLWN